MYEICVRWEILWESEIWCLRERVVELLRTERAMIRIICGANRLKEYGRINANVEYYCTHERMVRAERNILKVALNLEVTERRKEEDQRLPGKNKLKL